MAIVLLLAPATAWAQLSAGVSASRTRGAAPLYVFFDATTDAGTSHSDPDVVEFRDLLCEWDFGDPTAGAWSNSGASRNEAVGCIAAHVYEAPGVYTATLRVSDEAGNERTTSTEITVRSGGETWSGAETVCFENGGGFAGCPTGALQIRTGDYDEALASHCRVDGRNANRRCLFRRGDRFTVGSSTQLWDGPILIGAFGSGPRPVIDGSAGGEIAIHVLGRYNPPETASDIRIVGLEFVGAAGDQGNAHAVARCGSEAEGGIDDILLMDLTIRSFGAILACADSGSPRETPDRIALVNNTIHEPDHRSLGFLSSTRTAVLNNTSTDSGFRSSHVRVSFGRKMIFQHNFLTGRTGNTSLKLAGNAADAVGSEVPDVGQQRFWLISDNRIDCDGGNCIGGYNEASQGGISVLDHAVIERNEFRIPEGHSGRVAESCFAKVAWRNNLSMAGTDGANPFFDMDDSAGDCQYDRDGVRIYNNTFYGRGDRPRHAIRLPSDNVGAIVRNNLYYTPEASSLNRLLSGSGGAGTVMSDNVQTRTNVFLGSSVFDDATDFRLDASAAAAAGIVDGGFDLMGAPNDGEVVFMDFSRRCLSPSDTGSRSDLGAFESGAVDCESVDPGAAAPMLPAPIFLP